MKRLNFTLDEEAVSLLEALAARYYQGNKSRTVRAALESLASHVGHDGWVVAGYSPVRLEARATCHSCGRQYEAGDVLLRPVFERGSSPDALAQIPDESWLDCRDCAEEGPAA
jgi:hypothetical protein